MPSQTRTVVSPWRGSQSRKRKKRCLRTTSAATCFETHRAISARPRRTSAAGGGGRDRGSDSATPLVVVSVDTTFWETLRGRGHGFVGLGDAGRGRRRAEAPRREGRTRILSWTAPRALQGRRAGPSRVGREPYRAALRPVASELARRYPVVFSLAASCRTRWRASAAAATRPRWRTDLPQDRSGAIPSASAYTLVRSSYLGDSPVTGQWDTWLSGPALAAIDGHFRTLGARTSRGLIGPVGPKGSGGLSAFATRSLRGHRRDDLSGRARPQRGTFDAPGHVNRG